MRPAPLAALRAGLIIAAFSALAGCSSNTAVGALKVTVALESNTVSRCVKVFAEDGDETRASGNIAVTDRSRPLIIAIYGDALGPTVRVRAVGFTDEGCATAANEQSEQLEATFANPPNELSLTLRRVPVNDGGFDPDAGTDAGMDDKDAGVDAGTDAGVDQDQDGVPLPADCDDLNPNVRPGAAELCANGVDDDCDQAMDCADQPACMSATCVGGGTCVGTSCMAPSEAGLCSDGVDNDSDTLRDCLDPDCLGTSCNDSNACTGGERCVADGGCERTTEMPCTTPPGDVQCYASSGVGVCLPDAGTCSYTERTGGCDDGNACTSNDTCAGGTCAGAPILCASPPGACFVATGTCAAGTCTYAPRDAGTGTCSDGDNCTLNDTCAGDGGCAGVPRVCTPPSECHAFANSCTANGECNFTVRNGLPCNLGMGTCNPAGVCVANQVNLYPYTPSNFAESDLPNDGGVSVTIDCDVTINTGSGSTAPAITSGSCLTALPPYTLITPPNGNETMLMRVQNFTLNATRTLTITGGRPLILAAIGSVTINGTLLARAGGNIAPACGGGGNGDGSGSGNGIGGGGGGGFATAGGLGGNSGGSGGGVAGAVNGNVELVPLRGGCRGGNGTQNGGNGGGAVQVSASGAVTIAGIITAPGRGGAGATAVNGNSGGGGGSGGAILIEAGVVTVTATARLTANGGGGGEGSGGNPGDPGDDGLFESTAQAAGGSGSSDDGGDGGDGASLDDTSADNANAGAANGNGGGGGGGGLGRIRINASSSCTIAATGRILSPAPTSNGTAGCP